MACAAFKPIYWSGKDTQATVAEVKEHNAALTAICPEYKAPAKRQGVSAPAAKSAGTTFKDRWYEGVKVAATAFR